MHKIRVSRGKWNNIVNEELTSEVCEDKDCTWKDHELTYPLYFSSPSCNGCGSPLQGNSLIKSTHSRVNYHLVG